MIKKAKKFNKEMKRWVLNYFENQNTEPYKKLLEKLIVEYKLKKTTAIALCMHMAESEINKRFIQDILDNNILIPNPNLTQEERELYTWDIIKSKNNE